eukprot:175175-Chlamydomonas_euryale.AAC.2
MHLPWAGSSRQRGRLARCRRRRRARRSGSAGSGWSCCPRRPRRCTAPPRRRRRRRHRRRRRRLAAAAATAWADVAASANSRSDADDRQARRRRRWRARHLKFCLAAEIHALRGGETRERARWLVRVSLHAAALAADAVCYVQTTGGRRIRQQRVKCRRTASEVTTEAAGTAR